VDPIGKQASWLRDYWPKARAVTPGDTRIVYPGWFVEYTGPKNRTIWCLNLKSPAF
jgi:hypothetical protein